MYNTKAVKPFKLEPGAWAKFGNAAVVFTIA